MKKHCFISYSYSFAILISGFFYAHNVFAGPADYVYTPRVEYGEREIDIKAGTASSLNGNPAQGASIGFGYGASEHWFTEAYLKQERNGNGPANLAEFENKFQLTDTGEYPVDLGIITELEAPLSDNSPWEFKFGPLFQTEYGMFQFNGNLLFLRSFGKADPSGMPYSTTFSYQWQVKYRWQPILEFGVQGLGDMGKWNEWNNRTNQVHRIGPAVFGKFRLGGRHAIKYNAALLFGTSDAAPNHTFRMQVEYEF